MNDKIVNIIFSRLSSKSMHHSNQTLDKKIAEEFKTNFVQVSIQDSES